jgi:simple sugar transport system permease protein
MPGRQFSRIVSRFPEVGVFLVLLGFIALFATVGDGFLSTGTLITVLVAAAEIGTIALGVSILMIAGEFDISVGSVYCFSTLVYCTVANQGIPGPLCFLITLAACAAIGCCNGLVTVFLGIPSFITTLGAMLFWRGLHGVLTEGQDVRLTEEVLERDGGFLDIVGGNPFAESLGNSPLLSLKMTAIWFPILVVVFHIVLTKTRFGNHVFATGGNKEAARNAGVKVKKTKILSFTILGALVGFTGATNIAQYRASTGMLGEYLELEAIAACVVGGNLLMGGRGTILGTVFGVLLLSVIRTGLVTIGDAYWYRPLTGIIIVIAVVLNTFIRKFEE